MMILLAACVGPLGWWVRRDGRLERDCCDFEGRRMACARGHIYEAVGRRDDAIADFRKAIELDPGPASRSSREGLVRLGVAP